MTNVSSIFQRVVGFYSTCWSSSTCERTWSRFVGSTTWVGFGFNMKIVKDFKRNEEQLHLLIWKRDPTWIRVGTSNYTPSVWLIFCETVSISFSSTYLKISLKQNNRCILEQGKMSCRISNFPIPPTTNMFYESTT